MTIEDVVMNYVAAATKHGEATEKGNFKVANREYKIIEKSYTQLIQSGYEGFQELLKLTSHKKDYVRLWSASHTLSIYEEIAKKTLSELSNKPNFIGITAQTTLEEWEKGNLTF